MEYDFTLPVALVLLKQAEQLLHHARRHRYYHINRPPGHHSTLLEPGSLSSRSIAATPYRALFVDANGLAQEHHPYNVEQEASLSI